MRNVLEFESQQGQCPTCSSPVNLSIKYDAVACLHCNQWLESVCDDPECEYCPNRPDTPINPR